MRHLASLTLALAVLSALLTAAIVHAQPTPQGGGLYRVDVRSGR